MPHAHLATVFEDVLGVRVPVSWKEKGSQSH
jgi:hypothetical protein